ncbi:iron-sulfur cluster biosynthesis family protein [Lederbergia citrea]|uniref:Iron-sulfur cluster biosynthesis family protein n=1 Tax=Lederbergia citrea TaxID=2833581 RepID=A0A942UP78_9BACI|nr:iron-sulfur cluster biosynthesis family protein [Lederbergia citrea]MBS4176429.1 iron-sulfur cluster biosynthesis family protein [Lederbergia citrea]MBS4202990.1 iron-sulfur cluster biosynthesis family protein [Lederbergia citrea]MBS4222338.1 iron-sulfur cluster biosynthesis family protein [Lederbergia citrea]
MVKLTITQEAAKQIKQKMADKDLMLKLKYETEGCGCVVSGVPTLELINRQGLDNDDIQIETNVMPVIMEKSKIIFFDDELKIDFSTESQAFRLASPGQILNGRMALKVKSS